MKIDNRRPNPVVFPNCEAVGKIPDLKNLSDKKSQSLDLWEWLQFGPFLAQMVVIRRCNLACTYCSEYDKTSDPVPFDDLVVRFEQLARLRTWAVCLTGGEPTLHPQLPDLLAHLTRLGFRRRMMITNGYFLTRDRVESLNESGLTDLQISIDGVTSNENTVK
ncbi:MAG: radical SAM protein, partial [Nitrospinaceae bacterium]|nr:radical SAM protein [Nitrospinaceae bacterium]NIR53744.1 radical SAM protein [Nitrospinaceae bacterium]NIS84153.1 radical SAM protein [Nitrospinaceae bacterium]NIT80953.1 radical SAM protein [Nitrospinaceae bacterium]NIU43252.1 radical SAM protein [Nitrospinaceae bacterium]